MSGGLTWGSAGLDADDADVGGVTLIVDMTMAAGRSMRPAAINGITRRAGG